VPPKRWYSPMRTQGVVNQTSTICSFNTVTTSNLMFLISPLLVTNFINVVFEITLYYITLHVNMLNVDTPSHPQTFLVYPVCTAAIMGRTFITVPQRRPPTSTDFCDVMTCSLLEIHPRVEGSHCLHLQDPSYLLNIS
jgi:hypothetical protein